VFVLVESMGWSKEYNQQQMATVVFQYISSPFRMAVTALMSIRNEGIAMSTVTQSPLELGFPDVLMNRFT